MKGYAYNRQRRKEIIAVARNLATIDKTDRKAQEAQLVELTGCYYGTARLALREAVHELKMEEYKR